MRRPECSIIVAVKNRAGLLGQTVDSIRRQELDDWELIIVDDGSTDGTDLVAGQWANEDARIRVFATSDSARGCSHARNLGFEMARGKYVVFFRF